MGGATQEQRKYTVAEYLEEELRRGEKLEYYNGYIYPMPGGTIPHNRIASNLLGELFAALRNKPEFAIFGSDQKIYLPEFEAVVYPDALVICGEPEQSEKDSDALTNPLLIIEVLSPSTAAYDRGKKFMAYRTLPSLREYALVRQDAPEVFTFFREAPDLWREMTVKGLEQEASFRSIEVGLGLELIYRGVEFEGK
jgi:Uma2 family endonuclease